MKLDISHDSKLARARLERAAQAKDKTRCMRWLLIVGAITLLALVTFAVVDYWLLLPRNVRFATSALLFLTVGLGVAGWRKLFRKPTSLKEAALDAETSGAERDCVVSTAAEYVSGKAQAANAYEPELAAALQVVAAQRLEIVPLPYRRTLRGPLSALAMTIAALVLFVVLIPAAMTALKRVSLPWLGAQYTHVQVNPQSIEVRMGQAVDISGRFSGRPPKEPRLHWQSEGETIWRETAMTKFDDSAFIHPLTNVMVPVKYWVSGGDAISPEFLVTPFIPPEVKELSIGLAYPDYTRLKPVVQPGPDIMVLRGSTATVHVRANVSLSRARLHFADTNLASTELQKGENELWTGSLTIYTNSNYTIELFDQKGRRGEDDMLHSIVATADAPPRVEILEPGQDMRADATNRIPVKVSVADDYGVAEIRLVYHKSNTPERSVVCQTASVRNGESIAAADIQLAMLGLMRYDVVAYYVEASDNNTLDGPGIGRSALYFIEITDKQSGPTPPPQPLPGQQVNLLVVQKQIIADTVVLNARSAATNYLELAVRQTNAVELGRLYLAAMSGAVPEAVTEMNSAIASMEQAIVPLGKRESAAAIPLEEAALAHLYRVLALMPDVQMLATKLKPPPPPKEQKPQTNVALREIRKPAPAEESTQADPEIEEALKEARELSRAQDELNAIGEKLAKAERGGENSSADPGPKQAQSPPAKGEGEGKGQGQGEGQGEGERQAQGRGQDQGKEGAGAKSMQEAEAKAQLAKNTNSVAAKLATTNGPKPAVQFAQMQTGKGEGTKPGKGQGQGKGKGKGKAAGQKGKAKGQGTKPGNGSGQPSNQQNGEAPQMAADDPDKASDPDTPEELAEKQEELSAEAKALGEMLKRLAGKGTRVGHNLARSANQVAEHMEGAALALKQGNASGAGRRGTQSSAELEQLVTQLERILGKRPDLTDVASEEAPKEYEAFISEYFRKLSYEK